MDTRTALDVLSALAHETRLSVFRALVAAGGEGAAAGVLAERLDVLPNTLSAHLSQLLRAGLVKSVREGRSIRYTADLDAIGDLLAFLIRDCCGGHPEVCTPLAALAQGYAACTTKNPQGAEATEVRTSKEETMVAPYNVLFLCTGNSARSLLAEAALNREGKGRFRAYSAGAHPRGEPHPYTLDLLKSLGYDTAFARSKSWEEFSAPNAPKLDFVFTVCDQAAAEPCPVWPGQPVTAHWGVTDPAAATGKESEKRLAFAEAYRMLFNRISLFISLPIASLDRLALEKRVQEIGTDSADAETV
ncbi:arsenate reductase [Rhodopseudomonas julia]|uniref:Arsenate reductase n=1 Tax=Rhodopseudomonas julia TaxID=200617 RepID=A0ABU0C0X6_9BRAD|nr:metalloregulator ArsR/SmtB family transcription factor [Rhodopseudomonas julia]MDQ0324179.1 arsenate reductase [Rhodopseudomonas julia]